jgi:hypothetical protein
MLEDVILTRVAFESNEDNHAITLHSLSCVG